mgnify:CR=1 FL=1
MSDKLVAFYSRAYENYVSGMIKTLDIGNTEIAAGIIAELTGDRKSTRLNSSHM